MLFIFAGGRRALPFVLFALLAIGVIWGLDWAELWYSEVAFERECSKQYPSHVCEMTLEREVESCKVEATRRWDFERVHATLFEQCLHARAAEYAEPRR